jgi:antitoxin component of MazEF toxin-antitoxin module
MSVGGRSVIKPLSRLGNSRAIILDRTLLDLLHLADDDQVEVEVQGDTMLVRAAPRGKAGRKERIKGIGESLMDRFAEAHRRLAK